MLAHLHEMQLAFPGQDVILVPRSESDAFHITVPNTEANVKLLKTRGYFFEQEGSLVRVYFPDESYLNN